MPLCRIACLVSTLILAAACSSGPRGPSAYDRCLQANMAVAMDWKAIREMCRRQVGLDAQPDPRPGDPPIKQ